MTGVGLLILSFVLIKSSLAAKVVAGENSKSSNVDFFMPGVKPKENNTYLCYGMRMNKTLYITGFKPKANMSVAHHMLVFGCDEPGGTNGQPWSCGEMESSSFKYPQGPVCKSGQTIMYAWGMDAPALALPKQVAFKAGGNSGINFIVLQVHYKDVSNFLPPKNGKDNSGVTLKATTVPQPKLAGVFLLGADGEIPPQSTTYMETACLFNENLILHPFGFRVHAHGHGKIVSGYRVRNGQWTEIGRISPQLPQMFYPVKNTDLTISKGDILAARCTMVNDENVPIAIGPTTEDEMCNFYMMYYVDGDKTAQDRICFSPGPPRWSWMNFDGIHMENVPRNASAIPDTNKILEETRNKIQEMDDEIAREKEVMEQNFRNLWGNDWEDKIRRMDSNDYLWRDDPRIMDEDEGIDDVMPQYGGLRDYFNTKLDDMDNLELSDSSSDRLHPQFNVDPQFNVETEADSNENPLQSESMSIIDDKNGGKGYEKTKNLFKQLNIPGGKGFYQESRKESAYSWRSPDAERQAQKLRQIK